MIISKTPYRISFVGGSTDMPRYFLNSPDGGAVLSTTIDKYCYISARYLPPFHEHKYRAVWSRIENCQSIDDITHPAIREGLRFIGMNEGVVINHDGDLPAASGMGSSSSFVVGLLNALHHLKGDNPDKTILAREAIYVEQSLIKNVVGNQDQAAASFGGLNLFTFYDTETCCPDPLRMPGFQYRRLELKPERKQELQEHLMLVFSGFSHNAPAIADSYQFDPGIMKELYHLVYEAESRLYIGAMQEFGKMVDYGWKLKRRLSERVSTTYIDYIYERALNAGAIGGKLLGAGGGGFLLLFCEPEKQKSVKEALQGMLFVPFKLEEKGSHILTNGA